MVESFQRVTATHDEMHISYRVGRARFLIRNHADQTI